MRQPGENDLAQVLNRDCYCISVDKKSLHDHLAAHLRETGLSGRLLDASSHLFAASPVFLSSEHLQEMQRLICAVDNIAASPAYRDTILARAPASARRDFGTRGVFFGYDFHLGANGPQLIEINTNAGGVLLSLYLAAAQQACCEEVTNFFGQQRTFDDAEKDIVEMFKTEWNLQRPHLPLSTIAIVDNEPASQFLHPEFLLFQSLFERHGIESVIADPRDMVIKGDALFVAEKEIDLVYNRLTDFYLELPGSACLLEAYQRDLVVLTPSPFHYALFADKRNLPLFSSTGALATLGVSADDIEVLGNSMPATVAITKDNAAELWTNRKNLFFKPATGYGSRGAYRGAKLTRRVWEEISQGQYIAQTLVAPSERQLMVEGEKRSLKLDIRGVCYSGKVQQLIARLYEGQTTNLRTAGGGLATVYPTPDLRCPC